jgi:hypothetical protein
VVEKKRFEASLGKIKKFRRPHLKQWLDEVVRTYHLSYKRSTNRRLMVHVHLGIM